MMSVLVDDVKYIGYTCLHPFNGFYELRFRRKRNWFIITSVFLMVGIIAILRFYHTGIIAAQFRGIYIDPLFAIGSAVFPFLIFAISNWSVTAIFDGNGKLADVLMVLAYALVPKLFFDLLYIGLSNILIMPELFMLNAIAAIGNIIFGFLVFCGLCVVHEYGPAKCIVTLIATAVAAILIIFVGVVYMVLMSRLIGLIFTVFAEITRRGML